MMEPCAYYARGKCKFGDMCWFAHIKSDIQQPAIIPELCYYFSQEGHCKFGNRCWNQHVQTPINTKGCFSEFFQMFQDLPGMREELEEEESLFDADDPWNEYRESRSICF